MSEDVKVICEVKDKILDLLHQANQVPEFSMGDVDFLYKATKAVKNACEIEEMMDDGYSEANRGKHFVRGHYSRDGGMVRDGGMGRDGYSNRRDSRGRYSRADARADMMDHLEMAVEAAPEEYKDAFRRFMRQVETA